MVWKDIDKLETAVAELTQSQERLAADFLAASQKIVNAGNKVSGQQSSGIMQVGQENPKVEIPSSIKWTVIVGISLITFATIGNTGYNIWKGESSSVPAVQDSTATYSPTQMVDSTYIQN